MGQRQLEFHIPHEGSRADQATLGRLDAETLDGGAGEPGKLAGTGEGLLTDKEPPWTLERARSAGQVMCVGVQSARQGEGMPEVNTSHNLMEPERVAVRPLVVWGEQQEADSRMRAVLGWQF